MATLSLGSGVLLTALMASLASPLADAMGTPQAAPVIVVLSGTLILSSAGVVPYARLQRRFGQRELFASGAVDFVVSTGVTLALVLAGMGPMALAVARLVAQASATAVQFVLSRTRPHFGFDRSIAGPALRFGLPLAGANLLSWALLNVDNIVIARAAGEVALGFYVLAFNVSSWPMTAIGTAIRSVSLAAFSRTTQDREVAGDRSQDPAWRSLPRSPGRPPCPRAPCWRFSRYPSSACSTATDGRRRPRSWPHWEFSVRFGLSSI